MGLGWPVRAALLARGWRLLGALVLPLVPAVAHAQAAPTERTARPPAGAAERPYFVGPSDVLQVFVWKEPELSRDVTVRLDGQITVPLLGDVTAAGRTPGELSGDLETRFARFLAAPKVTVGVSQANSTRFYVIGQVGRSGEFPLTANMTVLQALALAGGFREFANTAEIIVVRWQQDRDVVLRVNYKRLEDGKDLGQNIRIRPGDTIIVP